MAVQGFVMKPTTHRVHPQAAEAWLRGDARPPGDGFELITPWPKAARRIACIAGALWIVVALAYVFFDWLWQEIAAGKVW